MDALKGSSEAARGNRRFAMLALGGLALGTYFLYGGRMAQKEIEKGKDGLVAKLLAPWLTLSPATGGEEIKSTADHVKQAVKDTKDEVVGAVKRR